MEGDRQNTAPDREFDWSKNVWKLDCAPKVKLFSWKLLKGALPVGERLIERHIEVDPTCKRCGCNESIIHLLFQCQFAQKVWQLAPFATDMDYSGTIDLLTAWPTMCNQKCLPPSGIASGTLFTWIAWALWKARNILVFDGFVASPEETLSSAIRLAREWSNDSKPETSGKKRNNREEVPTPIGVTLVRSDDAWSGSENVAGLGWIIFDPTAHKEFQQRMEYIASPLMAEGLALREAVLTCLDLGFHNIKMESDSAQLIKCLSTGEQVTELHSVVSDILLVLSGLEPVSFAWLPRERNVEADNLAKFALNVFEPLVVRETVIAPN